MVTEVYREASICPHTCCKTAQPWYIKDGFGHIRKFLIFINFEQWWHRLKKKYNTLNTSWIQTETVDRTELIFTSRGTYIYIIDVLTRHMPPLYFLYFQNLKLLQQRTWHVHSLASKNVILAYRKREYISFEPREKGLISKFIRKLIMKSVNRCDWYILASNDERIVWHCLTRFWCRMG